MSSVPGDLMSLMASSLPRWLTWASSSICSGVSGGCGPSGGVREHGDTHIGVVRLAGAIAVDGRGVDRGWIRAGRWLQMVRGA